MDLVNDLVLTPFREIVEKGKIALENAGDDHPAMHKASQALVKEGERALKKIEPLCKKHMDEYGSNFMDALKENDEIAQYRTDLNELLWEFDEFIEVDEFDAEKFSGLQALSRKAAPRIYDIIMRMKLEPAPRDDNTLQSPVSESSDGRATIPTPPPSAVGVPPSIPPVMIPASALKRGRSAASAISAPTTPLPTPPPRRSLPTPITAEHIDIPIPPMPPNLNPWDIKTKPPMNHMAYSAKNGTNPPERRRPIMINPGEIVVPSGLENISRRESQRSSQTLSPTDSHASFQPPNESPTLGTALPAVPLHGRARIMGYPPSAHRVVDQSIPEHSTVHGNMRPATAHQSLDKTSNLRISNTDLPRQQSTDSFHSSVYGATSSSGGDNRTSSMSINDSSSVGSPVMGQGGVPVMPGTPRDSVPEPAPIIAGDDGLIPVDSEQKPSAPTIPRRDTSITLNSSFYQLKGFCEGAKDVLRGELGVKKVKKPSFSGAQQTAKCTHCFYELDWKEIELDINHSGDANFAIGDVGYRIRFLQKSHLPTKRADEPLYACLFCIQEGQTPHDGDATVFFGQKELCEHLSRHPRPLPNVPGVTVVEDTTIPPAIRSSYDLHLKGPVEPNIIDDKREEIYKLPIATAKEMVKKMYGMKLLHDRTPAFELAPGATIVGVTFPDKYFGEWCMGYHEGKYASFPIEVARLHPPPSHELRMGGSSSVRAVARWKFSIKEKGKAEWLKFDKGETINSLSWTEFDHWCWSGTNAKGKWGIFPKAFLDLTTIREGDDSSDRSSIISGGTTKTRVLGRFSSKRSDTRPETPSSKSMSPLAMNFNG
ncbi:hypothetical protein jhhlp_003720 [Lomentospora prolificans]|uniref:SH3 domain-containing protein n=1 Tax=Lomentospora prolificans TaxID=41688 RepID=A0A2N3N9I4_9PEZI|nr:hypothetical protein jhhlp_003720 [Lomentospora prolificans]